MEEGAYGLRVIKSFGRARHMFDTFDARSTKLYGTSMERVRLSARFWTFLKVIPSVTLILVLGFGAVAAGQGQITLGTLVAFITLMLSLVWPVAALGFLLAMTQEAMTAADRICEIFDAEIEIIDGPGSLPDPRGRVRFIEVAFRFPDADFDVLHDLNLEIAPGETLAVVGATGSGKTVFTGLVPRLDDVTEGSITIDGVDIRELQLRELRRIVATAFEDPTLFSMSARENLTLGAPGAGDDEVAAAIEVAQAQFVYDLPWGLDTRIGEQGMSLSGGQRQRLALARAVLARPACWCWTTRCRRWTSTPRRWSRRRCAGCWRTSPASWSPIAPRRCCSPTGSPCCPPAPSPTSARTPSCWPRCRSTGSCCPRIRTRRS